MTSWELEFACLIPSKKSQDYDPEVKTNTEPYIQYKGSEYKKTIKCKVPQCKVVISKLKRFYHWLCFVWFHSRARKCRKVTFLTLLSIFLLLFVITCVFIPLGFKHSKSFQHHILFHPIVDTHESYNGPILLNQNTDINIFIKPKNFHILVNKMFNISLGLWSLPHRAAKSQSNIENEAPYLLYFHSFTGDRKTYTKNYEQLWKIFHVITFDYRSYGDSSKGILSEENLINDSVQLYKWLKQHTNSSIFIWGDGLGGSVAAQAIIELQKENIEPSGLMLKYPFLSANDYLKKNWFIAKIVSYTLWYKQTITDPLEENNLSFLIKDTLLGINCPIVFFTSHRDYIFDSYMNTNYSRYQLSITRHSRFKFSFSEWEYLDVYSDSEFMGLIRRFVQASIEYQSNQKKQ